MNLASLVRHINNIADEQEPFDKVIEYVNDAIAKINVRLKANFPYADSSLAEEALPFPETYQRTVVVPFAVGRIKQSDSSQFEYSDAYMESMSALEDMASNYEVPLIYRQSLVEATSDIYTVPPTPFGWRW